MIKFTRGTIIVLSLLVSYGSAQAAELFYDDFSNPTVDATRWEFPTDPNASFYGRTQIRPAFPNVSGGIARLRLDTYNPTALIPGDSFLGSEMLTKQIFTRGNGIVFEARSRMVSPIPGGLVGTFFSYSTYTTNNNVARDEIDFELLSNDIVAGQDRVLTNVFDNANFSQAGTPIYTSIPGLDLTQFNTFRIE